MLRGMGCPPSFFRERGWNKVYEGAISGGHEDVGAVSRNACAPAARRAPRGLAARGGINSNAAASM